MDWGFYVGSAKSRAAAAAEADEPESGVSKEERQAYILELRKNAADMFDAFDRAILTLSGGAIGISFAFVKDICPAPKPEAPCFLLLAWIFWGISIACGLYSFHASAVANTKALIEYQKPEKLQCDDRAWENHNRASRILSGTSGLAFIAGIIALIYFVAQNLQ